jgi:hypothetical protein
MNWKRKNRCPECRNKLKEFGIDMDSKKIECMACNTKFSPLQIFRDSDIIFISKSLPQDKQETFLTELGFEKKTVGRTSKSFLYGFLSILILGSMFFSVMLFLSGHRITFLSPIIGGPLLCLGIYQTYKEEKNFRWRRKKT